MSDLNRYACTGRLVAAPELRYTPGGTAVASFRLAVNRHYVSNGEPRQATLFIAASAWGALAESLRDLDRGSVVLVEGRLELNEWSDPKSGQPRSEVRIVADFVKFIDRRPVATGGAI